MKKIEFFSYVQGVADTFPVIHARNKMPTWVDQVRQHYKVTAARLKDHGRFPHLYRCPGIFEILGEGYYVTMPWDVIIETKGDPWNFKWTIPSEELSELMGGIPLVVPHKEASELMPTPTGSLSTIIKISTPWHIKAPPGLKFLVLPVSYPDTFEFEHVPGILDPGVSSEINLQIRWYVTNGIHTLKAGTPIAQIIPLSEKTYEMICRDATSWDNLWVTKRRFLNNFSFSVQRKKLKEAYESHFK
jgi:hypothetical protein